jgi:hypothetical protein
MSGGPNAINIKFRNGPGFPGFRSWVFFFERSTDTFAGAPHDFFHTYMYKSAADISSHARDSDLASVAYVVRHLGVRAAAGRQSGSARRQSAWALPRAHVASANG